MCLRFAGFVIMEDRHKPSLNLSLPNSRLDPLFQSGKQWTQTGTRTLGWSCKGGFVLNKPSRRPCCLFFVFRKYLDEPIARFEHSVIVLLYILFMQIDIRFFGHLLHIGGDHTTRYIIRHLQTRH